MAYGNRRDQQGHQNQQTRQRPRARSPARILDARVIQATLAVALLALAAPVVGQDHPDSFTQPLADGCERDPAQLIAGTTPQWVYVNRDPEPQRVVGTVMDAKPTYTDLFRVHDSYDMNLYLRPDADHWHFLGTANLAENLEWEAPAQIMEVEWEQRAYSMHAWATWRDGLEVMGSWIWDCGHWGQTFEDPGYLVPGTLPGEADMTGEHTEIHPPRMVLAHRYLPTTSDRGDAVADIVISSVGTIAKGIEDRAAGQCDEVLVADCPQSFEVDDRDYTFSIQAPPKPAGATTIAWNILDRGSQGAPTPVVTPTPAGIDVVIPADGWDNSGDAMIFAASFHVGWDTPRPVQHLRVTLDRLEWLAELDGPNAGVCEVPIPCTGEPQTTLPPDEVNVYVDVGGQWRQLMVPGLMAVAPGDVFELEDQFDVYLSSDAPWRVFAMARECDQPDILECSADEVGLNEDAGIMNVTLDGPRAAGSYVGEGTSNHCRAATGYACYRLSFTVEDLGQLNTNAPVSLPLPHAAAGPRPLADASVEAPGLAALALGLALVAVGLVVRRRVR